MQKIKTDLNDNDFNVDTLYRHTDMFNDNFYFKKKKILFQIKLII